MPAYFKTYILQVYLYYRIQNPMPNFEVNFKLQFIFWRGDGLGLGMEGTIIEKQRKTIPLSGPM